MTCECVCVDVVVECPGGKQTMCDVVPPATEVVPQRAEGRPRGCLLTYLLRTFTYLLTYCLLTY